MSPRLRPSDARPGVTLLELLVVLLLLGVAAGLTAPALLRARPESSADSAARLMTYARGVAVRRGETLALDVAADGRWTLRVARGDSAALDSGTVARALPRRTLVTPTGLCLPDDDERAGAPWDPAACAPDAEARP